MITNGSGFHAQITAAFLSLILRVGASLASTARTSAVPVAVLERILSIGGIVAGRPGSRRRGGANDNQATFVEWF